MSEPGRRRNDMSTETKLDALHEDITDIKLVLKELTVAINRLALVEERQTQTAAALERVFVVLEKVEMRVTSLEMVAVSSKQTNKWVELAVWAAVVVVAAFVARGVGLLS